MFCCPACSPTRRGTVLGLAASTLPIARKLEAEVVGETWIDVHCHVFAAPDLPMYQFVRKVFPEQSDSPLRRLALAVAIAGERGQAPSAEDEARALRPNPQALRLRKLAQRAAPAPPPPPPGTEEILRAVLAIEPGTGSGATPAPAPPPPGGAAPPRPHVAFAAERAMRTRAHVAEARDDARAALGKPGGAPLTEADLRVLTAKVDAARASDFDLRRLIGWALRFEESRDEITRQLVTQYAQGTRLLLTPAMIDYDRWLDIGPGEGAGSTPMAAQCDAAAALSHAWGTARQGKPAAAFAAFAGFDPWRALQPGPADGDVVGTLMARIAKGDVIGVKLYPPMGFSAAGNAGRTDLPASLTGALPDAGAKLDAVLDDVFARCAAMGAPVMAHCADSNRSAPGYGLCADPAFWGRVLKRHPALRLNLAHFGGIWRFADPDGDPDADRARAWATRIAELASTYEGVFTDVGYASNLATEPLPGEPDAAVAFIAGLVRAHPKLARKLMYGSDWQMVAMDVEGGAYRRYVAERMRPVFPTEAATADFRWRNAARYLGLRPADGTYRRLAAAWGGTSRLAPFVPPA